MPNDLQNIGLRLPADLLARIDGLKGSRPGWKTRTDIMIALLEVGLSAGIAAEQVAGENVWDAIGDLRDRLASVEAELRSHPTQPAPTAPKQHGGLTEEERDAIAAAAAPTDRPTAAAPTAAVEPAPPPPATDRPTAAAVEPPPPPPPDHPKANGGRWLTTTQAVRVAEPRGGPRNGNTLKRLARRGEVEKLGLRYCPHGTKDRTLATFEDLMFPRMSDRLDI